MSWCPDCRWPRPALLFDATREAPADLLCDVLALERALQDPAVRADRARLQALLHPDFVEFGRSGRRYDRDEVLSRLPEQAVSTPKSSFHVRDVKLRVLGPSCVQLTYVTEELGEAQETKAQVSWRSSLWVRSSGCWQMTFHQATPMASTGSSASSS